MVLWQCCRPRRCPVNGGTRSWSTPPSGRWPRAAAPIRALDIPRTPISGQSLGDRGGFFFAEKDRPLRTGRNLEFFTVFFGTRKKRRIRNHQSKIFRRAYAPVSFFLHLGWVRDIFFFVKERPVRYSQSECRPAGEEKEWVLTVICTNWQSDVTPYQYMKKCNFFIPLKKFSFKSIIVVCSPLFSLSPLRT